MPRKKKFKNTKIYKFLTKLSKFIKRSLILSFIVGFLFLWIYPQFGNIKNTDVIIVYWNENTYSDSTIVSLKSRLDIAAQYYKNDYSDHVILVAFQNYEKETMKAYIASKWVWEGDIILLDSVNNISESVSEIQNILSIKSWNSLHFLAPYYEAYYLKKKLQEIPRTETSFSTSQRFYSFDNLLDIFPTIKNIFFNI